MADTSSPATSLGLTGLLSPSQRYAVNWIASLIGAVMAVLLLYYGCRHVQLHEVPTPWEALAYFALFLLLLGAMVTRFYITPKLRR